MEQLGVKQAEHAKSARTDDIWIQRSDWLRGIYDLYEEADVPPSEEELQLIYQQGGELLTEYRKAMAEDPRYEIEAIITDIIEAINETNSHRRPIHSINEAVAKYGLSLQKIRSYDLDPYAEIQLLLASFYAGRNRQTKAGAKLAQAAKNIILHESTNLFKVEQPGIYKDFDTRALEHMERSENAQMAIGEVLGVEAAKYGTVPITSIDDAIRALGDRRYLGGNPLGDKNQLVSISGEVEELESLAPSGFQELKGKDLSRRLADLEIVESELRGIYGQDATITYKAYIPIVDSSTREFAVAQDREPTNDMRENVENSEGSSDFSAYTFIEIIDATGESFLIAESTDHGNACYVVRGDVLRSMSDLIGTELSWEDVLARPKETARQLGARSFHHNQGGDANKRALEYTQTPLKETLIVIAKRWLGSENSIFEIGMQPTHTNRLPATLRSIISERAAESEEMLQLWLGFEQQSRSIGEKAVHSIEGDKDALISQLKQEIERLEKKTVELETQLETNDAILSQIKKLV